MEKRRTLKLALTKSEYDVLLTRFMGEDGAIPWDKKRWPGKGCPTAVDILEQLERAWKGAPGRRWEEFRDKGFFWLANRTLHIFGWCLIFEEHEDGTIGAVYPQRVTFRGFTRESEEENYLRITKHMNDEAPFLLADVEEEDDRLQSPGEALPESPSSSD